MDQTVKAISREFTLPQLIKFALPSLLTQLTLTLFQSLDDGVFVSRFVGAEALAALSIWMPIIMIMQGFSGLTVGAATICSAKMGEGKQEEANRDFSTIALASIGFAIIVSIVLLLFLNPVIKLLGTTDLLYPYVKDFATLVTIFFPTVMVSTLFANFYVTAGKPDFALITSFINGICNVFFDWLFICVMGLGIRGSAFANLAGNLAMIAFGLVFYNSKLADIHFGKPSKEVWSLCTSTFKLGASPLLTHVALGVNSFIANHVLLSVAGEYGISANTIVCAIQSIFQASYFGLFSATAPVVAYSYGERNSNKVIKIVKQSIELAVIINATITLLCIVLRNPIVNVYLNEDSSALVRDLVMQGMSILPIGFLFFGFIICAEFTFNSLQNPKLAAIVTSTQNIVFTNLTVIVLPMLLGTTGYWLSFPVSCFLTFVLIVIIFFKNKDRYGFNKEHIVRDFAQE